MDRAALSTMLPVGLLAVVGGLWLRSLGLFSASAALVAYRATGVPFGASPGIAALGFDIPPLPVVLALPFTVVPALRWDPIVATVVSAVAGACAAWWLVSALRSSGVGTHSSIVLALAAILHPAWLYAVASGSGSVVAAALLVAALGLHRAWQRSGEALPILASAFAMALAGLARYDLILVGCAVAVVIALGPRARPAEPRDERAAFSVAYAAAILGALGLWLVATGLVTGDPLSFIARSTDALGAPPADVLPVHVLLIAIPALGVDLAAIATRRITAAVAASALVALAATIASVASASPISLDAVIPLVPLTALVLGDVVAGRRATAPIVATLAPALVVAGAIAIVASPDWGEAHRTAIAAMRGRPAAMWVGERAAAMSALSSSGSILVDDRVDGVVALLLGPSRREMTMDLVSRDHRPPTDLVVVRTPKGRGASDAVARAWPTLYQGGAPWARLLGSWPVETEPAEYRLYAVTPVP